MKKSRFSEEQIIGILKEHKSGMTAVELCRRHGISNATFYKWRSKYGGMEVSDAKRLTVMQYLINNISLKNIIYEKENNIIKFFLSVDGMDRIYFAYPDLESYKLGIKCIHESEALNQLCMNAMFFDNNFSKKIYSHVRNQIANNNNFSIEIFNRVSLD